MAISTPLRFVPEDGVFALMTIDPVASLECLHDPEALAMAASLTFNDYLVFVPGTNQSRNLEAPYREEVVHFVLPQRPNDVPERFIDAAMSVPIHPTLDETHPEREPLETLGEFPWPGCFLSPFIGATVRTRIMLSVDPIVCELALSQRKRWKRYEKEDRHRQADREVEVARSIWSSTDSGYESDSFGTITNNINLSCGSVGADKHSLIDGGHIELEFAPIGLGEGELDIPLTVTFTHDLKRMEEMSDPFEFFLEKEALERIGREALERNKREVGSRKIKQSRILPLQVEFCDQSGRMPRFLPSLFSTAAVALVAYLYLVWTSKEMAAIAPLKSLVVPALSKHTATVIFVHGLGDSGLGWQPVAEMLNKELPQVKWVLPNAPTMPVTANGGMVMPSWFDILSFGFDSKEDREGMLKTVYSLNQLISAEVDAGIPANRIVLGGFSQGAAMTLLTGLTGERKLAGLAVLSGWLPLRANFKSMVSDHAKSYPIFWGHGAADPLVRHDLAVKSVDFLRESIGLNTSPRCRRADRAILQLVSWR
ncbi:Phospholipase/carboxylesterase [Mycena indigotica]|uniref:Acyl-protein thioesterase 1 n=1 Tax=Mycena indigotica TaxID=2126181 RepID=A0A8H6SP02_9AGAR|nr:Phospholipase/carboxylesterase [Mycena indigotica]KAF7302126.1 Phospholipase/carboxylesterase [Mycena indigotica]